MLSSQIIPKQQKEVYIFLRQKLSQFFHHFFPISGGVSQQQHCCYFQLLLHLGLIWADSISPNSPLTKLFNWKSTFLLPFVWWFFKLTVMTDWLSVLNWAILWKWNESFFSQKRDARKRHTSYGSWWFYVVPSGYSYWVLCGFVVWLLPHLTV